jgi:hypothetical protein
MAGKGSFCCSKRTEPTGRVTHPGPSICQMRPPPEALRDCASSRSRQRRVQIRLCQDLHGQHLRTVQVEPAVDGVWGCPKLRGRLWRSCALLKGRCKRQPGVGLRSGTHGAVEEALAVRQGDAMRTCCGGAPEGPWSRRREGVDIDVGESARERGAWSWAYRSQMRLARGWNNFTRPGVCRMLGCRRCCHPVRPWLPVGQKRCSGRAGGREMSTGVWGSYSLQTTFGQSWTATTRRAAVAESSQGRPLHDQGRGLPAPTHPMRSA